MDVLRQHLKQKGIEKIAILSPEEGSEAIAALELGWRNGMTMRNIGVYAVPKEEDSYHLWYPTKDSQDYVPYFSLPTGVEEALVIMALIASKSEEFDPHGLDVDRPRTYRRKDLMATYKDLRVSSKLGPKK